MWQNRKEHRNRATNNRDMAERAIRCFVLDGVSKRHPRRLDKQTTGIKRLCKKNESQNQIKGKYYISIIKTYLACGKMKSVSVYTEL